MIVKVCGITSVDDGRDALRAGADWIGLNLVGGPRRLDLAQADEILAALSDPQRAVVLVSLVEGRMPSVTAARLGSRGVRRVQLYGEVTPAALHAVGRAGFQVILVRPVRGPESFAPLETLLAASGNATPEYVLFDTAVEGRLGGTGTVANWDAIVAARRQGRSHRWPRAILAGGLTPENVAVAIRTVQPAGVDVSSGVESEPGCKDPAKVAAFVEQVRRTESQP